MVYNNPEKWVKTSAIQVTHTLGYNTIIIETEKIADSVVHFLMTVILESSYCTVM